MIVLIQNDTLRINTPFGLGIGLQWYVSWEIIPPPTLTYSRNFGNAYLGPGSFAITPVVPAGEEFVIRQISIFNRNQYPINVAIEIWNGALFCNMFTCMIAQEHTLQYNASPDGVLGWQTFDASGQLVNQ